MKKYIKTIIIFVLMIGLVNINGININATAAEGKWPKGPAKKSITAESAIVMELNTGAILYEKNIHDKHYPASITKIMTTLLCLENASMTDTVTFSSNAVNSIEYGSSHIGVVPGEKIKMEDCLYGIMLMSANEVCNGVAEHIAGDIDSFVDMMNNKAKELGCEDTHFANTNGLYLKNHYTSAYDMALISRAAMKNNMFRKITGTKTYTIPKTNKNEKRGLYNKHNMLHPTTYPQYGYDYCIGGKTGYTNIARWTLVTFAKKGDMELVCVVMKTAGPPPAEPNEYTDTIKLLNSVFDNYSVYSMSTDSDKEETEGQYSLFTRYNKLFDSDDSPLYIQKKAGIVLPNGVDISQAEKNVEFYNDIAVTEGENIIGKVTYTYAGKTAGSANIYYNTEKVSDTNLNSNITQIVNEAEDEKNKNEAEAQEKENEKGNRTTETIIKIIAIIAALAILILIVLIILRRTVLRRRYIRMYNRRKMLSKYSQKPVKSKRRRRRNKKLF